MQSSGNGTIHYVEARTSLGSLSASPECPLLVLPAVQDSELALCNDLGPYLTPVAPGLELRCSLHLQHCNTSDALLPVQ